MSASIVRYLVVALLALGLSACNGGGGSSGGTSASDSPSSKAVAPPATTGSDPSTTSSSDPTTSSGHKDGSSKGNDSSQGKPSTGASTPKDNSPTSSNDGKSKPTSGNTGATTTTTPATGSSGTKSGPSSGKTSGTTQPSTGTGNGSSGNGGSTVKSPTGPSGDKTKSSPPGNNSDSGTTSDSGNGGDTTNTNAGDGGKTGSSGDTSGQVGSLLSAAYPNAKFIAHAEAVSSGGTASATLTFGQVFVEGAVDPSDHLVVTDNGRILQTQSDPKATWSDGSLRHAIITVVLPKATSTATQSLSVYAVSSALPLSDTAGDTAPTLSELLNTGFNAKLTIDMDSQTYVASARDAIQNIVANGSCPAWGQTNCKLWLHGPLVSEWIVAAPISNGQEDTPLLRAYFNIRAYRNASGAIANVRVDTVVENDLSYDISPTNRHYDAQIQVGQSSFNVSNLTHYVHARWHHVLWSGGSPERRVLPSTAYLQESKAVSKFANVSPTDAFLQTVRQKTPPMGSGDQTPYMGTTGAQSAIGPLPQWTAAFVVSDNVRAFHWMLANDDAAGSYPFHYRDAETGRPLTIVNHPYVTLADYSWASRAKGPYTADLLPYCRNDCNSPLSFEIAHQPSIGYVSYLVTGDYYYLEELQFEATYDELWANESYRGFSKGLLLVAEPQVRGQAWVLRTISNAAFATPDSDPLKSVFVNEIDGIIAQYVSKFVDSGDHPLHVLDAYGAVHYPANQPSNVSIAPWQQDFFTWAVGHAAEQGVPGAARLLAWFAPWYVGIMTTNPAIGGDGYCWLMASAYTLKLRDSNNSPIYTSLKTVYEKSMPELAGLRCNSAAMRKAMPGSSGPFEPNEMFGYPSSPTGFPANLQIALAAIADTDANGAQEAWHQFTERSDKPDYSNAPQFAVVPRPGDDY